MRSVRYRIRCNAVHMIAPLHGARAVHVDAGWTLACAANPERLALVDLDHVLVESMTIDRHTMTSGDVARVLGVSRDRVLQLDDDLQPVRREGSLHRRYDPTIVAKVAKRRAVRAAG